VPETTQNLKISLLAAGQAQKHVTMNDALVVLDDSVQLSVKSRSLTAPPAVPQAGERHIVATGATGAWSGSTGRLALWQGSSWRFADVSVGHRAYVEDEDILVVLQTSGWTQVSTRKTDRLGINTDASTANRLAVASAASLFSHEGTSHRLKINKAAVSETASIIFQDSFSGRAEIGLSGNNDLRMKVSNDGNTWRDGLQISAQSGRVAFPSGLSGRNLNLAVNGDFLVNQRAFAGGTLAAGAYGFDRWKAGLGGASLTRTGTILTLASGSIIQVLEPELWGETNFANAVMTVSIDDLTGGNLEVSLGSATQAITPGSGRRGATLTVPSTATGALELRLATQGTAVSFTRVKVEAGPSFSDWEPRAAPVELQLCRRYFSRVGGENVYQVFGTGYVVSAQLAYILLRPPLMRVIPALSVNLPDDFAVASGTSFVRCTGLYAATTGLDGFLLGAQVASGLTAGFAAGLTAFNTTAARLSLNAEL
jgi:Protein of unknown function (DUF2793)